MSESDERSQHLINSTIFHGLQQRNDKPNHMGRFLDLVFTNHDLLELSVSDDPLLNIDKPHPPLLIKFSIDDNKFSNNIHSVKSDIPCYKKTNFSLLNSYLSNINWDIYLDPSLSLDNQIKIFYDTLSTGLDFFVPKARSFHSTYPPWFSQNLKLKTKEKKECHKQYKLSRSEYHYERFSALRRECKNLAYFNYETYVQEKEKHIIDKPRSFFNFIKDKKHDYELPRNINLNGESSSNPKDCANMFAKHFSSVYSKDILCAPQFNLPKLQEELSHITINHSDVYNKLNKCKDSSSCGPDGVPPIILKNCALELAAPLALLFQRSIDRGYFPEHWKSSYVVPIHKSQDKNSANNYRPVNKISAIPKVLEAIVNDKIKDPLSSLITPKQHGFLSRKSTCTNLVSFYQFLTESVEDGKQIDCVQTDFSKAFDKVNINILIAKLQSIGVSDPLLSWLYSYLTSRTQKLNITILFLIPLTLHQVVFRGAIFQACYSTYT
ncbi:hypothetical protein WDU94_012338 [Cyamophila willieti]